MPKRDGTGPMGIGVGAGRRQGFCFRNYPNNFATEQGIGYGRLFNRNRNSTINNANKNVLVREKELLLHKLDIIEKQLGNISN